MGESAKGMDEITKHAVGAPTKYHPGMIDMVQEYIDDCPNIVPSIVGLATVLGVTRRCVEGWKVLQAKDLDEEKYPRYKEFLHMLRRVSDFQEQTALDKGANGEWNPTIAKLILAKHGYHDKVEQVGQGVPTVQVIMQGPEAKKVDSEVVERIEGDTDE